MVESNLESTLTLTCFLTFGLAALSFFQRGSRMSARPLAVMLGSGAAAGFNLAQMQAAPAPAHAQLAAALLMIGALLLFWAAIGAHREARPAAVYADAQPPVLTTRGPYALIRHPFYASYLLAWIGSALAAGHVVSWLAAGLMCIVYARAAAAEERVILAGPHAAQYARYVAASGRFIPRLFRASRRASC